jgi:aminopeptidase S
MTTTDTGSTAHDKLAVQLGSTTVKTFTNTGAKSIWTSSAVSLAPYAGQTVTLTFTATNDASNPTTFWVDDVAVG